MKKFKVTKKATRPAGDKNRCFYCGQKIGEYHKEDCVLINKKVLVRATIEYEVNVPNNWKKSDIEFHRNDGTWCSSNMLRELDEIIKEDGCLCPHTKFKFIKETSSSFIDE